MTTDVRTVSIEETNGHFLRGGFDDWLPDPPQATVPGGGRGRYPLCEWCEPPKTEADVHEKSRKRLRHAGIKLKAKGRPLPGTFASGWKHRMDGGWERGSARQLYT
jgi:hypothetical protein